MVPLLGADGPLGLLTMCSRRANAFNPADRDLLSQIGTQTLWFLRMLWLTDVSGRRATIWKSRSFTLNRKSNLNSTSKT